MCAGDGYSEPAVMGDRSWSRSNSLGYMFLNKWSNLHNAADVLPQVDDLVAGGFAGGVTA